MSSVDSSFLGRAVARPKGRAWIPPTAQLALHEHPEIAERAPRHQGVLVSRHAIWLLRAALSVVFIWFGFQKPLGLSPATDLVVHTVTVVDPGLFVPLLGWWEVAIGLALLFQPTVPLALLLMAAQMAGTLLPLFVLPERCFTWFPLGLSLEGQYIIKNLVLISAGIVIASSHCDLRRAERVERPAAAPGDDPA